MGESSAQPNGQIGEAGPSRALLNSLHPSGEAATVLSLDQATQLRTTTRRGDVVVLTMTAEQCRDASQRRAMIQNAVAALASDGVLWVDVPGQWRSPLKAALRSSGMVIGRPAVRRARGAARVEFALTLRGLRFMLASGLVSPRWRLALAGLKSGPWAAALLLRFIPDVSFSAFWPGTMPFKWLMDREPATQEADVAVATNWRGERAPFLVFALANQAILVAKRAGPECHAQIAHEAAMLRLLGAGLANVGLEVPRLIDSHTTPKLHSLIETHVPGRPLASWIREGRHRDLGAITDRLAEWLSRWNSQTVRYVELTPAMAEQLILSAARDVEGAIAGGSAYVEWISRQTGRLIGHKVTLVAAHNDLTMANVLGDRSGIRAVIDWEAASPDGLPLADFRYASCDAAALIGGGDRVSAFRACFLDRGDTLERMRHSEAQLRAIIGGPPEWLELCIHACWLRHAANEQARSSPRPDKSFNEIVTILAGIVGR